MPVQTQSSNGKCWAQWGDQGAHYEYECGNDAARKAAEDKAYEQGKAIIASGGMSQALSIVNLAVNRVSFDFDGTLTQGNIQDIVKRLITAGGTNVYIISARDNEMGMYSIANKLGIPNHRIFATGSNEAKIAKIKELNIDKHYDNNKDVIKALPNVGILVN